MFARLHCCWSPRGCWYCRGEMSHTLASRDFYTSPPGCQAGCVSSAESPLPYKEHRPTKKKDWKSLQSEEVIHPSSFPPCLSMIERLSKVSLYSKQLFPELTRKRTPATSWPLSRCLIYPWTCSPVDWTPSKVLEESWLGSKNTWICFVRKQEATSFLCVLLQQRLFQYYIFTYSTIPIFKPWILAEADINCISLFHDLFLVWIFIYLSINLPPYSSIHL